ncbi:unnamed protein product [Lepeophtheirus salmonis]|uniref:(salmon louse) hypothetical protein n=1 Tax=Lepeophtheirus salmonis TaxID=72036 RepID=A0A817FE64_LEPSM|nr:unnamed protein product [Lepeophtheirus salmonis]CAG9478131.1 unnamed protein product [Lepeophtheirus salmonis]
MVCCDLGSQLQRNTYNLETDLHQLYLSILKKGQNSGSEIMLGMNAGTNVRRAQEDSCSTRKKLNKKKTKKEEAGNVKLENEPLFNLKLAIVWDFNTFFNHGGGMLNVIELGLWIKSFKKKQKTTNYIK